MCPDFGEITQITVMMTSFKVTNFGTNEKPACDFLCDYLHSDLHFFRDMVDYLAIFSSSTWVSLDGGGLGSGRNGWGVDGYGEIWPQN